MLGRLILASASSRRLSLLAQIGIVAAEVVAAEIEEAPRPGERPRELAARLAKAKANHVAEHFPDDFVLGADTVVACGRRILPKANDEAKARTSLELISGRCHRVLGGVSVIAPGGGAQLGDVRVPGRTIGGHLWTYGSGSPLPILDSPPPP